MNKPFPQPIASKRRKLSVEVYFVLYLSAIILLMGTSPFSQNQHDEELEATVVQLLKSDFEVDVEKVALIVPFIPAGLDIDTAGIEMKRDSLNTIRAHGLFTEANFNIAAIEDTATGQAVPVQNATLIRDGDSTATFQWRKTVSEGNAVYRVTVEATALPRIPDGIEPESLRNRIREILARRGVMRDSVTFSVNVFAIDNMAMVEAARQVPGSLFGQGGDSVPNPFPEFGQSSSDVSVGQQQFSLSPVSRSVRAAPRGEWTHRVNIFGVDPVSSQAMEFSVPNGVSITERTANRIVVSGIAPTDGSREITISAHLPNNPTPAVASFSVNTGNLDAPEIPQTLYRGHTYNLDFGSSGVPSGQITVQVTENGKIVLDRNTTGAIINYIPGSTGNVRFVRYINSKQFDDFSARIILLPNPVIRTPTEEPPGSGDVYVETVSYGMFNGRANKTRFIVMEGNVTDPVQVDADWDKESMMYVQTWKLSKADENEPLRFKAYAIDQRGSTVKSNVLNYSLQ